MYPSLDVPWNVVFCIPRDFTCKSYCSLLVVNLQSSINKWRLLRIGVISNRNREMNVAILNYIDSVSSIFRKKMEGS
jgi:hypothetical protein